MTVTDPRFQIRAQAVHAADGSVVGLEVTQVAGSGQHCHWTFRINHLGPNSSHFGKDYIRGETLIDTAE